MGASGFHQSLEMSMGGGCAGHSDEEGMSMTLSRNQETRGKEKRMGKSNTANQPSDIKGLGAPDLDKVGFGGLAFVGEVFGQQFFLSETIGQECSYRIRTQWS